jgi:death-on-curing family protein
VARAERATGLAGSRQKRIGYWANELELSRGALAELLAEWGFVLSPAATTVPKGAVRRLRSIPKPPVPVEPVDVGPSELAPAPRFEWVPPGQVRQCDYLTADEIESVHEALAADFALSDDPISPPGVKSRHMLESAAARPASGFGEVLKYPTVESAAAAMLHSLVHNHPFHNGNKRSALVSTLIMLDRHNLVLESSQEELFKFMIRVAAHDLLDSDFSYDQRADREVAHIASWFFKRTRPIRREDRAITWLELSRRFKTLGCEILYGKGEWVVIRRTVKRRGGFLRSVRPVALESKFRNTGDGRTVPKVILKRLRSELELDPEHGVDAEVFYGEAKGPDYFILEYSQLLRRLARV